MTCLGPHAAIRLAHHRVAGDCRGEQRIEIDVDGDGGARAITWLFYVPPSVDNGHRADAVRLPLITVRRGEALCRPAPKATEPAATTAPGWPGRMDAAEGGFFARLVAAVRRCFQHLFQGRRPLGEIAGDPDPTPCRPWPDRSV